MPERVEISAHVHGLPQLLFRCGVAARAERYAVAREARLGPVHLSDAEITQLEPFAARVAVDEEIRRFDVAVDDARRVHCPKRLGCFEPPANDLGRGETPEAPHARVEGLAIEPLEHQEAEAIGEETVVEQRDHVRMPRQSEHLGFALEAIGGPALPSDGGAEQFESDALSIVDALSLPDRAARAEAQLATEPVRARNHRRRSGVAVTEVTRALVLELHLALERADSQVLGAARAAMQSLTRPQRGAEPGDDSPREGSERGERRLRPERRANGDRGRGCSASGQDGERQLPRLGPVPRLEDQTPRLPLDDGHGGPRLAEQLWDHAQLRREGGGHEPPSRLVERRQVHGSAEATGDRGHLLPESESVAGLGEPPVDLLCLVRSPEERRPNAEIGGGDQIWLERREFPVREPGDFGESFEPHADGDVMRLDIQVALRVDARRQRRGTGLTEAIERRELEGLDPKCWRGGEGPARGRQGLLGDPSVRSRKKRTRHREGGSPPITAFVKASPRPCEVVRLLPGMEIKQTLRLSQQLVMTPQLQQAIKLLQLSRLELIDEVRKELDNNPVLSDDEPSQDPERRKSAAEVVEGAERSDDSRATEKATREVDWEKFLENRTLQNSGGQSQGGGEELPPIEQNLTRPRSLRDHLLWQLQMSDFTDDERRFAELVIGNLDERGYLDLVGVERPDGTRTPDLTIDDLADESGLDREDAPLVLEMIQNFDPPGVASRDLRECLQIQARGAGYGPGDTVYEIISNHIGDLERHNYPVIARAMRIPMEELYELVKEIQTFESTPARNYTDQDDRSIAITPDVYVIKDGSEFRVVDNDRGVQRLFINEALTRRLMADPQAKEFIGEKLRSAQWLIRAIEQRRKTIIRVTECIVDKQSEFLERGVAYLKPMILRDVAEAVGMHESTISRVTTNKYVHTPQGLFELKYFFNSSIRRVADEDIASESVKQAIKKIIDEEDKAHPLSDQTIVERLASEFGIKIARRTVAKYREMLGILASSRRRRAF